MGIELHPKFLSLTGTRCYPPLSESIVAKCCQVDRNSAQCAETRIFTGVVHTF
jgi:hypothetical protein